MKQEKNFNLLTFDLEEWFHILDLPESAYNSDWNSLPSRMDVGLERFLNLLSRYNVSGTFFILGWAAEEHPDLVRKINSLGHEIASHGYGHELIYNLGPGRFRQDIRRSKMILEDLIGNEVRGFRGPGFSITPENVWAFDIIAEEGFQYDSTLYPGNHEHGGLPGLPCSPFTVLTSGENYIEEYPITLMNMMGYRMAFAGGGYFRLFPFWFISRCISHLNNQETPVMLYLHPRDLDPDTPHLPMPWKRQFKCYVNLSSTYNKLDNILNTHPFGSIREWRITRDDTLPIFSLKDFVL